MQRPDFELLFRRKLDEARELAEEKMGKPLSRSVRILRHDGRRISVEQAVTELFVSETEFYRIIDLAVVEVSPTTTWVWVRESGHRPATFEASWNQPPGSGPFKQLISDTIRITTDAS